MSSEIQVLEDEKLNGGQSRCRNTELHGKVLMLPERLSFR